MNRFIPACAGNTCSSRRRKRYRPVHPRVRGEHTITRTIDDAECGSSPRARGTRPPVRGMVFRYRFIPACAGNTPICAVRLRSVPVHPRVRGEHGIICWPESPKNGSSPRARGTPCIALEAVRWNRFIPACAGNTARRSARRSTPAVHPRVRGEHASLYRVGGRVCGSSPRARGTRMCYPPKAGRRPVHPRVRGEHL